MDRLQAQPPLYVAPAYRSKVTRTTSPLRPEWMDAIKRPLRIVACSQEQLERFAAIWHLSVGEIRRVTEFDHLRGVSTATPLLELPRQDAYDAIFPETDPLAMWKARGGLVIEIPKTAVEGKFVEARFPDEFNLLASTIVQFARTSHLDSLNGKRNVF